MELAEIATLCDHLGGTNLRRLNDDELRKQLVELLAPNVAVATFLDPRVLWYRGVECGVDGFPALSRCLHKPAKEQASRGRAHFAGQEVFYAASNRTAVLCELKVPRGSYVQIVAARPFAMVPCNIIGEIAHQHHAGSTLLHDDELVASLWEMRMKIGEEKFMKLLLLDSFLASQFSSQIARQDSEQYRVTSEVANMIMDVGNQVLYPSIQASGAVNIAVRGEVFCRRFEVLWVEVVEVVENLGFGVYHVERRRYSCDIAPDGAIDWDSAKTIDGATAGPVGTSVPPEYNGWRHPIARPGIEFGPFGMTIRV